MNYETGCLFPGIRIPAANEGTESPDDLSYCHLGFETDFWTTVHPTHFLDNSELIVSLATEWANSQFKGSVTEGAFFTLRRKYQG